MHIDEINRATPGPWLDEQVARHVMLWPEPCLRNPVVAIPKYSRDANRTQLVMEKIFDWPDEMQSRFSHFLRQQIELQLDDARDEWVLLLVHASPGAICKAALAAICEARNRGTRD